MPADPRSLWEEFKYDLSDDFIRRIEREFPNPDDRPDNYREDCVKKAYKIIAYKLEFEAIDGRNFHYWVQNFGMDPVQEFEDEDRSPGEVIDRIHGKYRFFI